MATLLPDLIDQATLAAYLADLPLTPAARANLPGLAGSASAAIRRHCNRLFSLWSFDELYTAQPGSNELVLKQFPVISVERVASGLAPILTLGNLDPVTNQRATLTVDTTADPVTGALVPVSVTLRRVASGVTLISTLLFSAYPTVQALAAAVNALGGGWEARAADGYTLWATADAVGVQGARPALGADAAELRAHVEDLDFTLRPGPGLLRLGPSGGSGSLDSPRFGPFVGQADDDAGSYGGLNGVRVAYTAGFATAPPDVAQYTAEIVKAAIERFRTDSTLQSESDGVLSWAARGELLPIPSGVMTALSSYVNHRA